MVTKHIEERFLDSVHAVEMASLDSGREFSHRVYGLVPDIAADLTKLTDAWFDFAGALFELQRDSAQRVLARAREADMPVTMAPKAAEPAKRTSKKAA